jgi:hypothetical protein
VTREPIVDGKQPDLFGGVFTPKTRKARAARPKRAGSAERTPSSRDGSATIDESIAGVAARLSLAELDELAAVLSDEALARLVLAAARQMRRRLARCGKRAGSRSSPALERAARQLAVELGGEGAGDDP